MASQAMASLVFDVFVTSTVAIANNTCTVTLFDSQVRQKCFVGAEPIRQSTLHQFSSLISAGQSSSACIRLLSIQASR